MKLKMPKQWKYWCQKYGLKPKGGVFNKNPAQWHWSLVDKNGRNYRVNCNHEFQICDGDMDRWANSVGATVDLPKTESEFSHALFNLLKMSEKTNETRIR